MGMSPRIKAKKGRFGPGGLVPTVKILTPQDGETVSTTPTLSGSAYDDINGDISANISWVSDVDGALGTGASIVPTLTIGPHVITASVSDGTNTVTDTVTITVA